MAKNDSTRGAFDDERDAVNPAFSRAVGDRVVRFVEDVLGEDIDAKIARIRTHHNETCLLYTSPSPRD